MFQKTVNQNRIHLTNREAQILIAVRATAQDKLIGIWRKVNESTTGECWSIFDSKKRIVWDLSLEEEADAVVVAHNAAILAAHHPETGG